MTTRAAYDAVSGNVANAADVDKWAKGWVCNEETTSNATTSATTELTLLTASVPVLANRRLVVSFHCPKVGTTVNADEFLIRLYYDGATFQRYLVNRPDQSMDDAVSFWGSVATTTAGNKTIAVTAQRLTGTGVLQLTCGAGFPMAMLVEDVGSSS